jgi:hypothetical protein
MQVVVQAVAVQRELEVRRCLVLVAGVSRRGRCQLIRKTALVRIGGRRRQRFGLLDGLRILFAWYSATTSLSALPPDLLASCVGGTRVAPGNCVATTGFAAVVAVACLWCARTASGS